MTINQRKNLPFLQGALFYAAFWGAMSIFEPFINVYFINIGVTGKQLGIIGALFPLMSFLLAPVVSAWADKHSRRRLTLAIAFSGIMLGLILLGFAKIFPMIFAMMLFYNIFRCIVTPLGDSIILRVSEKHRLSFGSMRLFGSVTFAILALIFGFVWDAKGYDWMLFISAICFLPAILITLSLEEPAAPIGDASRTKIAVKDLMKDKGLMAVLIAAFFTQAGLYIGAMYGGIYMEELGGDWWMIGLLFCIGAASEIPPMQFSDKLIKWLKETGSLLLAYIFTIVSLLGAAMVTTPTGFLITTVFRGAGFALYYIATVKILDQRVPLHLSSTVQAVMGAGAMGIAPLIISPIAGWLYDIWDAKAVYAAASILPLVSIGIILVADWRKLLNYKPLIEEG